ncbi:MAG TPA: RtcB family protein [Planctomycetota bacterium]|nr:RtcB family protein [Planctomycetota bacterium]
MNDDIDDRDLPYDLVTAHGAKPIYAWTKGVAMEYEARKQLENIARLPIVHHHVAAMPDVHLGIGATVGSVIPTVSAIVPAAVGVDIGCGMCAVRTTLTAKDLPESLKDMRAAIERAVPHGRTDGGGANDRGAWGTVPNRVLDLWADQLAKPYSAVIARDKRLDRGNETKQLGTLGGGNHFIEICLDEAQRVWVMLHSGSRGVGNRIGQHFIELAKHDLAKAGLSVPDRDLAYLREGTEHFDAYVRAVSWAQSYARVNRQIMLEHVLAALKKVKGLPPFTAEVEAVNCHHNYVNRESHYGAECWVTRKGAVSARLGELGIIPGSMGARSFIVRGKGEARSFHSCSHGAGRAMSRGEAKRRFTMEDHAKATADVECRKDKDVIDETPMAYKDIDAVMAAQGDLVEIVHTLKQVVCVKG